MGITIASLYNTVYIRYLQIQQIEISLKLPKMTRFAISLRKIEKSGSDSKLNFNE